MTADLSHATLGQLVINVHDLDRATAYYRDTLGLPLLFQFPGLAFFRCGDVRFMLSKAEKPEFDHPGSILYYKVPDVVATHAALSARGVAFVDQPVVVPGAARVRHRAGVTHRVEQLFAERYRDRHVSRDRLQGRGKLGVDRADAGAAGEYDMTRAHHSVRRLHALG